MGDELQALGPTSTYSEGLLGELEQYSWWFNLLDQSVYCMVRTTIGVHSYNFEVFLLSVYCLR